MAATQSALGFLLSTPWHVTSVDLTAITPGPVNVTTGGPSGLSPDFVTFDIRIPATSGDPLYISHVAASDVAGSTARIQIDTVPGGDLTGASVRVFFHYKPASTGGLTNVA